MKSPLKKKGFGLLANLPTVVLLFGIAVIITSIVAQITGSISESTCTQNGDYWNASENQCLISVTNDTTAGSHAHNITISGLRGLAEIGSWYVTIGLIIGAIIVLSALFLLMQRR